MTVELIISNSLNFFAIAIAAWAFYFSRKDRDSEDKINIKSSLTDLDKRQSVSEGKLATLEGNFYEELGTIKQDIRMILQIMLKKN